MSGQQIGFVGIGNMGYPMSLNLMRAGYELVLYDRDESKVALLLAQGATSVSCIPNVVPSSGIVFTMVPNDQALRDVTLGENGLLEKLCPGGVHVSLSTVSPELTTHVADLYAKRGGAFLAGTVLGRPDVAERATLSIFVSGESKAKARVMPLLHVLGTHVYDMGHDVAAANVVKLGANFLILAALVAMGEAADLVQGYGIERSLFLDAMATSPLFGGAVYSGYGQMIGLHQYKDKNFPVGMGYKDACLILDAAQRINLTMPVAQLASHHLQTALEQQRGDESWAVLAEFATQKIRTENGQTKSDSHCP